MPSLRGVCFAILAVLALNASSSSQEHPAPKPIVLYPAPAAALGPDRRLLPEYSDQIPGNAAVFYGKVKAESSRFFGDQTLSDRMERIHDLPLDEILRERPHIGMSDHYLMEASRCETCDWQLPRRREPLANFVLSEVSDCQLFGRILGAKTRVAIAQRDYPTAINRLRYSYALGRHVAAGETIVNGLVGAIICSYASKQALTLIQQPDAPNLYWSLARLPRPMIDLQRTLEAELGQWEMALPELRQPESPGRSQEQWEATLLSLWQSISEFNEFAPLENRAAERPWNRDAKELLQRSLDRQEIVRQELIEQGWPAGQIDAMPAAQVALIDSVTKTRKVENAAYTAFFLPYPQAAEGLAAAKAELVRLREESDWALPLGPFCLEAMTIARTRVAQVERELAVLQFLEALRDYAAREGRLPERLNQLTAVPVPNDPVADRPFRYFTSGESARLAGPPLGDQPLLDYEIRLGKPN